jgi:hypothetical protein
MPDVAGHAPEYWPLSRPLRYEEFEESTPDAQLYPSTPARPAKRRIFDDSSPARPAKLLRLTAPEEALPDPGQFDRRHFEREVLELHHKILQAILAIQKDVASIADSLKDHRA